NDGTTSTVTVNLNPATYQAGANAGQTIPAGYVEVIATYYQQRYFSAIWSSESVPISGRAVARGRWVPSANGFLVLAPSGTSVSMGGTANIQVGGGKFTVDSIGPRVFLDTSSVKSTASEFDFVSTAANLGITPASSYLAGPSGTAPTINYSQSVTPDPLTFQAAPSVPVSIQRTGNLSIGSNSSVTLNPGLYQGNISVSGSANVTLNSGTYYVQGSFTWNSSGTLDGTRGVLIYVVPGSNTQGITITSGTINVSPMTSGTYQGISLWQERTSTARATL